MGGARGRRPGRRGRKAPMTTRILVVDNYDSFVWTIAGYLAQLGADCDVLRNDAVTAAAADGYDGVLLSPGPGVPAEAGVSQDMVRHCADTGQPLLGVCLGHQALGEVFGGTVAHAPELMHGKTSLIEHDGAGVLEGSPPPSPPPRSPPPAVPPAPVPAALEVTGRTASGVVMALQHRELPLFGVQFHP